MEETFEIKSPGVDVHNIMELLRRRVEEKREAGYYDHYDLTGVTVQELESFKSDEGYLDYYLRTIFRAAEIDLGDFQIPSKSFFFGRTVVVLKKIIWKLLKFYTFRLFSQQKDFNSKISSIVQGLNRKFERRLTALEEEVEKLRETGEDTDAKEKMEPHGQARGTN